MTAATGLCCLLTALAAALLAPGGADRRRGLPRGRPGDSGRLPRPARGGSPDRPRPVGGAAPVLLRPWTAPVARDRNRDRDRQEQARRACRLAGELAAVLRAGLPVVRAWQLLADRPRADPRYRAAARYLAAGGSAGDGIRALSGPGPFAWLAAACDLSEVSGAPLADVLDGFVEAMRAEEAARGEAAAAVAGPRATATVLSWLPLAGLGLGALLGADCPHVLLGTGPGRSCLAAGGLLWWTGRWWSGLLVRRAAAAADRPCGTIGHRVRPASPGATARPEPS